LLWNSCLSFALMPDNKSRWIVFGLAAAAFWLSFFHRVAPGALSAELSQTFEVSGAALGALAATYFYIYMLMQIPTGILVDTLGPRRVLAAGGLLAAIGSILFGTAASFGAAASGRTLVGLGVSVTFVSLLKLSASWFHERRFATAAGFGNVIGIAGALTATAPLAWLIARISWRDIFVVIGIASLMIAAATWFLVRDEPHARTSSAPHVHSSSENWRHALLQVLRNEYTWPAFWVTFGISGSYMSFIGLWVVPFLSQVYGMPAIDASRHASLIILCSACSLAAMGLLSDHFRRRRLFTIVSAVMYLGCWATWIAGVPSQWTYPMAAITGFSSSGFCLAWACAKEVNQPRYAGMAVSVANTGGFLAAGILQPLVGWVLDTTTGGVPQSAALPEFRWALAVLMSFALIGLAGALFIRETRCRNIWVPATSKSDNEAKNTGYPRSV
jgi:predicted MFS family arabinose efflux permease